MVIEVDSAQLLLFLLNKLKVKARVYMKNVTKSS